MRLVSDTCCTAINKYLRMSTIPSITKCSALPSKNVSTSRKNNLRGIYCSSGQRRVFIILPKFDDRRVVRWRKLEAKSRFPISPELLVHIQEVAVFALSDETNLVSACFVAPVISIRRRFVFHSKLVSHTTKILLSPPLRNDWRPIATRRLASCMVRGVSL